MNKWIGLVGLLFLTLAFSCSGDRVFEEFYSFKTLSWNEKDTVVFDLKALKEKSGQKLIGVRFNEEYPFSNCYIRVICKDTTGQILDNKLINVPLFDSKSGQPKGGGFGNTFTIYDTLPFEISDQTSEVVFLQYMRQENLPGLEAVGLKILK
ncbi:MAG TPA: gliding motility lipoprotein GldH [Algoriphagus sp.]|nr:gliding motility lipoprotein GldH [Algoriphagus sp.]